MWFFFSLYIVFGDEAINYLEQISGNRTFIITDKNLEKLGIIQILIDKFEKWGKNYNLYSDISGDQECNETDKSKLDSIKEVKEKAVE